MAFNVYDMRAYYQTRGGRLTRRMVGDPVRSYWQDVAGLRVTGYGYALPYLPPFDVQGARVNALVPRALGVHSWPDGDAGRVALTEEGEWPLETESADRILMIHALEHADDPALVLREAWRVLKSNGRMLLIVPNRMGLWARADWTPFGHGRPFTAGQLRNLTETALFTRERSSHALFVPPFHSFAALRMAWQFEAAGRLLLSGLAGAFIVELGKQVYAGTAARTVRRRQGLPVFMSGQAATRDSLPSP